MRKGLLLVLIVAGLLAAMAGTRWLTQPPPLRAENAPGQFDASRAKARLARVIGSSPAHPADSASSDGVRARLVAELRAAGLQPRVDDRFACNKLHKQRGVSCARVRNVLVTIGRQDSSAPHVLVNSHYDSVPVGPGASDAGLGVAAMIEAAVLLRDRPLVRPVTFLFNEGEELGLVGARAFLEGNPLSRRIDALINLEARGTTGPVNMFETSVPNAAAVRLFARSVEHPVANSLAVSAYRLIPNYTDVNTFVEERDWLFLNFAPIGNETRYHSPGDDLEAVDLATLQHMGDQLMQTAGALGSAATPEWKNGGNKLFMNLGTRWLVTFEAGLAIVLGLALLAGWWLRRSVILKEPWRLRPMLTAAPVLLLILLVPVGIAYAGLGIVGTFREGQFWRAFPKATELAIYAGVIAAGLALLQVAARRWSVPELRRGWWLLFVLLGLALSLAAPGALVYFVIPPLIFFLSTEIASRWRHAETVGAVAAALFLFVSLGGMLGLLQDLLNGGPLWIFALFGGLVLMPWLIEARPLVEGWSGKRIIPVALAFAALAWVPAAVAPAYSSDRQQQWTLQYVVDSTQRQPLWSVVNDRKALPAEWKGFGNWQLGRLPIGARQRWLAPAPPAAGIVPARVLPVEAAPRPGGRRVRLRLQAGGNDSIMLIAPAKAKVAAMGVPGQVRTIDQAQSEGFYSLTCTGRSCDGQVVELWIGPEPVELMVVGTRWALPAAAAPLKAAQPVNARAQYLPDATLTVERIRI